MSHIQNWLLMYENKFFGYLNLTQIHVNSVLSLFMHFLKPYVTTKINFSYVMNFVICYPALK